MSTPAASGPLGVAAFDFDGTISRRDTLAPFLARVGGTGPLVHAIVRRSPRIAAAALRRGDRDAEKQAVITRVLGGRTATSVAAMGRAYADHLWTRQRFRPAALELLRWHREQGHRIVIVSASLDSYLVPLAPRLGVDHVISCSLETDSAGLVTGTLLGGNVRGPEKANRLRAWLGGDAVELWAYGDSSGDDELLAMADHPTRV
ncbi:MAG: HAD-IB family hydrolase [Acidimicrobiia bacterium]